MLSKALLGAGKSAVPAYIEDVFSTYLYTGNGSTQTITNGIDLAGKGGMVWLKCRDVGYNNEISDTARGVNKQLVTNTTAAQQTETNRLTNFNSNGFTLSTGDSTNQSTKLFTSWTFREQAKFFDVVTYTGTGVARTIPHNLGSVPGTIIVKITSFSGSWFVYHRSLGATKYLLLDDTGAAGTSGGIWNNTEPTSSVFSVGNDGSMNSPGQTYVAYLFAHDAGGFGLTGTDNVISCGSFTTDGSGAAGNITLGYEAQWVLIKRVDAAGSWLTVDTMRGSSLTSYNYISPNTSNAENSQTSTQGIYPTATGFFVGNNAPAANATYIYIAIRRAPMKTPTTGTEVFGLSARTGTGANATVTGGQTNDAVFIKNRGTSNDWLWVPRLTGTGYLISNSTSAETAAATTELQANPWDVMNGIKVGTTAAISNASGNNYINYLFKRAPGFMDIVCYTGTGATNSVSHNLNAVPELIFFKRRNLTANWPTWRTATGTGTTWMYLNDSAAEANQGLNILTASPTSTTISLFGTTSTLFNASGSTYVAYLFATVSGVSKVGTYTGNGSSQTVNCGFAAGARFVMIKRTDSAGDWYVWDTARGIVAGNDQHLSLNTNLAEVTTNDTIDPDNSGFIVNQVAATNINVNASIYLFLAIA